MSPKLATLAILAAAACNGNVGTVSVTLTTAPGSHILDAAQTLELVLTNPHEVTTATRTSTGFSIELDLPATTVSGSLIVEALDASGTLVAAGESPPFPVDAIDAGLTIYMAAPNTVGASPSAMSAALTDLGVGTLSFGAVFAGGADATGAPSTTLAVYNAFDHSLTAGVALPAARAGLAVGVGAQSNIYLFGGRDASGAAVDNLWTFVEDVAPAGAYTDEGEKTGFARADAIALPIDDQDDFLLSGTPAAELAGPEATVTARSDVAALPAAGASTIGSDGMLSALFADATGVVRFHAGVFDTPTITGAARAGAGVAALPGGRFAIACGSTDLVVIDAATEMATTTPNIPSAPRSKCAIAATSSDLVIAGGTLGDGTVATTAEIYDATTFALIATTPLVVPRTGATAVSLPNDQVLLVGGVDATGAPSATIELFTPAPPQ